MAKKLEIKPEFIGAYHSNKKSGRPILIEEGNEKLYKELGFKIFKEDVASKKRTNKRVDSDSNGKDND